MTVLRGAAALLAAVALAGITMTLSPGWDG